MTAVTAAARTDATPAAAQPAPLAPLALPSGVEPTPARVLPDRTRALGTYLFMVADAMVLATIIAAYFAIKDGSSAWPPVGVGVGTYIPFIVTITVTMAACSAKWALNSVRLNDSRNVAIALVFTIFLGFAAANAEWAAFGKAGFGVGDHAYGTFYYVLVGYHLAHLLVAVVLLGLLAGRSLAGHFSAEHHDPLRSGVLFFQYSNAIWFAVATVLFVFSRVHGLMAKSAVLTQPSRIFLPIAGASLGLGFVYGAFTGDWLGISLYLLLMGIAGFAGVVVAGFRVNDAPEWIAPDADPPTYHEVVRTPLPAGGAWPFTAALAVTLVLLGLVVGPLPAYFGLGLGLVTVAGWLARVSADTTGRQINLLPIGIPVLGLFCIASLMFFMSRILLAVPEEASTFIALAVAVTILGLATLLATRPKISARTMVSVLGVAGLLMIAGGLVAASAGERKIEHEGKEVEAAAATLVAKNIAFDVKELSLPANTEVDVDFKNTDKGIPHNLAIYNGTDATGAPVFKGDILAGPAETKYHFTSPAPGDYHFQCDVHPNMSGTVKVA